MSLYVDIHKKLDSFELDVKFEAENETLALFGASGCGKSMTLRCIAGIMKPDRGRIVLNGKVLFDSEKKINLSPQKRNVGYLFQQYALFPNMTVTQNIACGMKGRKDPEKIASLIKAMHLEGLENKYPSQISGGQQQRTALARILIGNPDILMLDEPFSALDTHLRQKMEMEVRNVIRQFDNPVLFVSHDNMEVYRVSDRIAIMHAGKIEKIGDKKEVYLNPETVNGALLTGYRNVSKAEYIGDGKVRALEWGTELQTEDAFEDMKYIAVRTDKLVLGEGENGIPCKVKNVVINAFSCAIIASPENGNDEIEFVIHVSDAIEGLVAGSKVMITIDPSDIISLKE